MRNSPLRGLVESMRPAFLVITVVCVFLGASVTVAHGQALDGPLTLLVLAGALLAHVSVNLLNEYHDFRSGLDAATLKTPFSGGSGALLRAPAMARPVLVTGVLCFLGTLTIGLFLVYQRGWGIAPVGILGLAIVALYTPWLNRYPLACLVAPGLGVGVLVVAGTQFVLEGAWRPMAWLAAMVPFCLANNLLLLNQYPDSEADAAAGRRHFVIAYGIRNSNIAYGTFVFAAMLVIVVGVVSRQFPPLSLTALLPVPLAFMALGGAARHGVQIGRHPRYLAANAAVAVLVPLVLGLSLILG